MSALAWSPLGGLLLWPMYYQQPTPTRNRGLLRSWRSLTCSALAMAFGVEVMGNNPAWPA